MNTLTRFRLDGVIGADHRTGLISITLDGDEYVIDDSPPTATAQATLAALVVATRREDWSATYRLSARTLRQSFPEDEWVANSEAGLATYGRIVDVVAGALTNNNDAYVDFAIAPFSITVEKDGSRRVLEYTVALVWEERAWRVSTTSRPPSP